MASERANNREYELGHSARELRRLWLQAQLVDPFTRQFFSEAGIADGMRVLDVGSGAGDTALVVAELVGETGEVVGIDKAPLAIAAAQSRIDALGKRNISFREGDLDTAQLDKNFDAVVGRYVLMFNPDPASMLRSAARHVRSDGVIAFHEVDWSGARSSPAAPLYDRCVDWIVRTFRGVGTNPHMGLDVYSAFIAAGIPAPTMALSALIGGSLRDITCVDLVAELAITMIPVMEQQGVIRPGEIDPAKFLNDMLAEVDRLGSVVIGRSEVGAWARAF